MKKALVAILFISSLCAIANRKPISKRPIPLWLETFNIIEKNYTGADAHKWIKLFSVLPHALQQEIMNDIQPYSSHAQEIKSTYLYSLCGNPQLRKALIRVLEEKIKIINAIEDNCKRTVLLVLWNKLLSLSNNKFFFLGAQLLLIIEQSKKIVEKKV